tara:strand:+ start:182 stop:352 length:171 start_codon:yes stop_codon:yes gene_type:complete
MNDIEQRHIKDWFGDDSNKTMEDYFTEMMKLIDNIALSELKSTFKEHYPDESNWSF